MAADPSQNVHEQLLPHVHLINTYRYALMPRVDLQEVTKWLLAAPKIARDTAPFFWTFLDAPQDGTILLTWQPLQRLHTEMATDGYVWAGAETCYQHEVGNGLILELYHHRAGYRPGSEQFTAHCRRRFRLTPPKMNTPNMPQVDPSLWIVHYGPAENSDRMPITHIPLDPRTQWLVNARFQLQKGGQIARKEFMLSDRVNWPQIPLPREARGQPMYAGQGNPRAVPQQMAYPPHPAGAGPPSKRPRHAASAGAQHQPMIGSMPPMESAYDDEEDTSRGDMFDNLTPREVSIARYRQNHEWMEEVLSSPYRMGQIVHADLGLGLMGELAPVTQGIFEAQGSKAVADIPKKPYIGRLDEGLADDFRKRVAEKLDSTKAEIEKMEAEHAQLMASLKANSLVKHAEQELRYASQETGSEIWRLEGRQDDAEEGSGRWNQRHHKKVEDIVLGVEGSLGRKAEVVKEVSRAHDGGYQEPAPEPIPEPVIQLPASEPEPLAAGTNASMSREASQNGSQTSGVMLGDSDIDMGGTAAGLLDQMHTGFSSTSTPVNNFPTPQAQLSAIPSSVATPANANVSSPQNPPPTIPEEDAMEGVTMDTEDAKNAPTSGTAPDQGTGSGEWVVVPEGGVSPGAAAAGAAVEPPATDSELPPTDAADEDSKPAPIASSKPGSGEATPAVGDSESAAFDGDNNDFSSLGDLDSAGDALAGYDPPTLDDAGGDLGDGLDLHMDMEDSAFGDAFHGVDESRDTEGNTPADGGL